MEIASVFPYSLSVQLLFLPVMFLVCFVSVFPAFSLSRVTDLVPLLLCFTLDFSSCIH